MKKLLLLCLLASCVGEPVGQAQRSSIEDGSYGVQRIVDDSLKIVCYKVPVYGGYSISCVKL
jgi:hypothetical protein